MKRILVISLRGNIIGDSVRETAFLDYFSENLSESVEITYPCGSIIHTLLKDTQSIVTIPIKSLNKLNSSISKLKKLYYVWLAFFMLLFSIKGPFDIVCYSGSKGSLLRFTLVKLIAFFKKGTFCVKGLQDIKGCISTLHLSKHLETSMTLPTDKHIISICMEASEIARERGVAHFVELITQLADTYHVYILGTNRDYKRKLPSHENIHDMIGSCSIDQSAYIIKKSSYYIGNDSGLLHIAAALGIPIIALLQSETIDRNGIYCPGKHIDLLLSPTKEQITKIIEEKIYTL